jgi:hypothetical protein
MISMASRSQSLCRLTLDYNTAWRLMLVIIACIQLFIEGGVYIGWVISKSLAGVQNYNVHSRFNHDPKSQ